MSTTTSTACESNTAAIIAQSRALYDALGISYPDNACHPAGDALRGFIDAVLIRDLDCARRKAGVSTLLADCPKRYTEQSDWRDYCGWLCKDERTAQWVAAWIARYMDPRDSDGNAAPNVVHEISGRGWLAVSSSHKIGD